MKALIVVDMQNDFVDGAFGTPEAHKVVTKVVNKMKEHQYTDTVVLFTKDTHDENYLNTSEGQKLPVEHCIKGTVGWSVVKPIREEFKNNGYMTYSSNSIVRGRILKSTFGSPDLIKVLQDIKADEIELCGVCTDICVISNALMVKAYFPETKIIVDSSCCAGSTPEKHAAALEVMKSCQIEVIE